VPDGFSVEAGGGFEGISLYRLPLQQILYNLVNNAIKHHDKKSGLIRVDIEDAGNAYLFSVSDDGPGIDPQYHQKIFEMFQTLKPRDQKEGSGMGLAIVKKILTTCGGRIVVESEPGKGTTFKFTWPKNTPA
jgi:signal transduction histidine kinase